jgi:hypothetical protein
MVSQDISRGTLSIGRGREQNDASDAERRNRAGSATAPSYRTIWYGLWTRSLTCNSGHGNLNLFCTLWRTLNKIDNCFSSGQCFSTIGVSVLSVARYGRRPFGAGHNANQDLPDRGLTACEAAYIWRTFCPTGICQQVRRSDQEDDGDECEIASCRRLNGTPA